MGRGVGGGRDPRWGRLEGGGETGGGQEALLAIESRGRPRREKLGRGGARDAEHRVRDELQACRAPEAAADVVDLAEMFQDRPCLREILLRATNEDRECPALDGGHAAQDPRL